MLNEGEGRSEKSFSYRILLIMKRGRPKIDPNRLGKAVALVRGGFSVEEASRISGISKSVLYEELKRRGDALGSVEE